ncbi:helix-turn-helix transcriptional regulator [Teredinibacter turnerae]|uniref:helix-turn-helix transcriptional regulator n=1 Tax=Teredinibacter turnerae TaxID=2426 RepID=UPI0005F81544|nr:helix-turn-helix transcriptional regulator [Teredinibacter turnerae]
MATSKPIPAWLQPVVLLDLLAARGINALPALQGTALFPRDRPFTGHQLSPQHYDRLLANGHRLWRGDDFCFQLAHQLSGYGIGPLAEALGETAGAMAKLTLISRFANLASPSATLRIHQVRPDDCFLLFGGTYSLPPSPLALRCALALISRELKRSEKEIRLDAYLRETSPADRHQFQVHVAARCHFGMPINALRLRTSLPQCERAPTLRAQVALQQCAALSPAERTTLTSVQERLWSTATSLNLPECALQMGMSAATLKRRLQREKISFQQITDNLRAERALIDLLLSGASVEEIGARLNFHDSSNFRRAFKRWTGMTPSDVRAVYRELFSGVN